MYITKQQLKKIIENAPAGTNPNDIVNNLVKRGAEIEGYNQKVSGLQKFASEVVRPFAQAKEVLREGGMAIGATAKAGFQLASGKKEEAMKTISNVASKVEKGRKTPIKSVGLDVKRVETPKQAVGLGLELASNVVGGGGSVKAGSQLLRTGLKQSVRTGVGVGLKSGALYGAGSALQEDRNVLGGALTGGLTGAVAGAVLPVAGAGIKTGFKAATSPFSTVINKIAPKLDRIAGKIETTVLKPTKTDINHGFKVENIFKYDLGGGLGQSLQKTETMIDDLVLRAENMRGQSKSVIDLNKIFSETADEISSSKISTVGNNKKILNAFKTWAKEIEEIAPSGKITSVEAQKIKVALGKMGSWLNGQRDLDANAMESVSNVLYSKFKNAIEKSVGDPAELRAINKQLSELIPINNVLVKRIPIAERNSAISLTDLITGSAGMVNPKAWGLFAVNKLSKSGRFANVVSRTSQKLKSGATKLLPLETGTKNYLKNIKPGLSIEDVSPKGKGVIPKTTTNKPLVSKASSKKYNVTVNIQDKNDLEYLGRILSEDQIKDIKAGKMVNFRGIPYEDMAKVNFISETPKTIEQQLSGKINNIKLKSNTFYHGTSAENADSIIKTGFKTGKQLPEDTFRGGGYGQIQDSISLAETPKDASRFSQLSKGGKIIETKINPNSKVISIKGIEDANDLEDFLPYLKKQKIDAVYIGGGEKELVIINPKVIIKTNIVK